MPAPQRIPLDPAIRRDILRQSRELLDSGRICQLVTTSRDGYPMLRGMGYLNDGWTIYMSTIKGLAKEHEIRANPRVSALFIDQNVRRDHFVQIHGLAREVTGADLDAWQERRFEKYPHERQVYDAANNPWFGWIIEPIRVRTLGYVKERNFWGENPVVFNREHLDLPPLEVQPKSGVQALTEWSYQVADIEAEARFWREALGAVQVRPAAGEPIGRYAMFDGGGPRVQLQSAGGLNRPRPGTAGEVTDKAMFLVDDLDRVLDQVAAHGGALLGDLIVLEATETTPRHRFAYVVSPNNQTIGLVEGDEAAYRERLGMRPLPDYWGIG